MKTPEPGTWDSVLAQNKTMLTALRKIRREANFSEDDGAMDLGERLIAIEDFANAALKP